MGIPRIIQISVLIAIFLAGNLVGYKGTSWYYEAKETKRLRQIIAEQEANKKLDAAKIKELSEAEDELRRLLDEFTENAGKDPGSNELGLPASSLQRLNGLR